MKARAFDEVQALAFQREVSLRREALVAAYCQETGLRPSQVVLRERRASVLCATWAEPAPARPWWQWRPGRWLRDLRWRLPGWRGRFDKAAKALHDLGLNAAQTVLFQEYGDQPTSYYAERKRLQVRCQVCRRQVALDDWQAHVDKVHSGAGLGAV